jgi:tellurite resistance protein TerC
VLLFWVLFTLFVLLMLSIDLRVLNRRAHRISSREALAWSGVWIALAAAFAVVVLFWQGHATALQFITGYIVELSLSVDNLFVFLLIFRYFKVPDEQQHRVLVLGILGALITRALFIFAGVSLINRFAWITYLFGAFLVYTGFRLMWQGKTEIHPEKNPVLRLFRKAFPVTDDYEGGKFFVRREGLFATPLFIVLLVIETTDVVFTVDSIPAVLAITLNAFIVYTSNVFAILGLRSMYFALAGMMEVFDYLHYGLAVVLIFIGVKMLGSHYVEIPTIWALGIVVVVLATSVAVSVLPPKTTS